MRKSPTIRLTRRTFIGSSAGVFGAAIASSVHARVGLPPLRIGAVGIGAQGVRHLETAARVGGIRVSAVCDAIASRQRRGRRLAQQTGCDVPLGLQHAEELIASPLVDGVVIATGAHEHGRLAVAALMAGKHVYVETPLVRSLREAHDLKAAAAQSVGIIHTGVHGDDPYTAIEIIDTLQRGVIGEPSRVDLSIDATVDWKLVDSIDVARRGLRVDLPASVWSARGGARGRSVRAELLFKARGRDKVIVVRHEPRAWARGMSFVGPGGTLHVPVLDADAQRAASARIVPGLVRFFDRVRAHDRAPVVPLMDAAVASVLAALTRLSAHWGSPLELDERGHATDARVEEVLWG